MFGTIKMVNVDKGFGFIKTVDGIEFFFHRTACARDCDFESLVKGEKVEFEEESGKASDKGPRAKDISKA